MEEPEDVVVEVLDSGGPSMVGLLEDKDVEVVLLLLVSTTILTDIHGKYYYY
jgi:hypothetical protein